MYRSAYKKILEDTKLVNGEFASSKLPLDLFYNEAINQPGFNLKEDFRRFINPNRSGFTFCKYAFILDPAIKSKILQLEAAVQKNYAIDNSLQEAMMSNQDTFSPYLVLSVNRTSILADTLEQIQLVNTRDFKKQLKVKFIGEDGIDQGGVLREFFAVIIRDLFNPQYGMFDSVKESNSTWFNSASYVSSYEYELIGILLGLAIFNGIILDIHFPIVVYKKLLRRSVDLEDLFSLFPVFCF